MGERPGEDRGPERPPLVISQSRAVSHGFLLFLIIVAALYIALTARGMSSTPDTKLPSVTTVTTVSSILDEYLIRPPTAVPTVEILMSAPAISAPDLLAASVFGSSAEAELAAAEGRLLDAHLEQDALAEAEAGEEGIALAKDEELNTGAIPEQRGPVDYEVEPGDTISEIAARFGISNETILWANDLKSADLVKMGQKLLILPVSGIIYSVVKGDTLLSIASRYGVDTEEIVGYPGNRIGNADSLKIGQEIIIPGGHKAEAARAAADTSTRGGTRPAATAAAAAPAPAPAPARAVASGNFIWPNRGLITTYFSGSHSGLDIASPTGTPIAAADAGVVVDAQKTGWGLGWYITIDHGNGYQTTYAHMSSFAVGYGERVAKGEMIGRVGSTGNSTGPHNHFVVVRNGVRINPLSVLP